MASTTLAMSGWQYTVNGGSWQQGSGHDVSIGIDGSSNIYRGYVSFSLASFSASHIITSASLYFRRADAYGNKAWAIGLTDTKPAQNFSTSAFQKTISSSYTSGSNSDNMVSITAANLSPYVGKTVYVLFINAGSGNSYGEIETDTSSQKPTLTINYNYAKSTLTASNATAGTQTTFTVTRQDNSYTHTLTAKVGNNTETIVTKSSNTSINWTPAVTTYAPLIGQNGSATVTYTLTTYSGNTEIGTDTVSKTMSIPAASSLTASNGTFGTAQTISVTRNSTSYTHTLTAAMANNTETIVTKVSTTSISWNPSVATWAPRITSAMSASCVYTLTTYCSNTVIGSATKTVTWSLPSASVAPTLSLSVVDNNGYASHFNNKYIIGKSAFKVTATPSYKYGATQSSLSISANGSTYSSSPATTGAVKSGQTTISSTVKDSRGQTASASTTVTLLAYSAPGLSVNVQRCQSDGTADNNGAYCKVTSTYTITALDNINTRSLDVKYKKASAGTYTTVSRTINDYTGTDTYIFSADTDSSYNIQVVLSDYFGSTTVTKSVGTISVVFDLHNSGTGMAFGKVAESANLLDIAWPVWIRNQVLRIHDSAGTRRVMLSPNNGGSSSLLLYDDAGQYRVLVDEHLINLYNASGTLLTQMRTDGAASSNPLPVNQGGTGKTTQFPTYQYVSGNGSGANNTWIDICSMTLKKGYTYIYWGTVSCADANASSVIVAQFTGGYRGSTARGTAIYGGGVTLWGLAQPSSTDSTLILQGYHNQSGTNQMNGNMIVLQFPSMPTSFAT